MKERPILFSTDTVKAILEGRKSQTRRMVKLPGMDPNEVEFQRLFPDHLYHYTHEFWTTNRTHRKNCPYGQPGDRLWARESFRQPNPLGKPRYYYKADDITEGLSHLFRYKPSIHMPKAAARIWLEITEVRVEKLQDISKEDAEAEGVQKITVSGTDHWKRYDGYQLLASSPVVSFWSLWAMINGEESWEQNPWVWVVCFKVLSTTGRPA